MFFELRFRIREKQGEIPLKTGWLFLRNNYELPVWTDYQKDHLRLRGRKILGQKEETTQTEAQISWHERPEDG